MSYINWIHGIFHALNVSNLGLIVVGFDFVFWSLESGPIINRDIALYVLYNDTGDFYIYSKEI